MGDLAKQKDHGHRPFSRPPVEPAGKFFPGQSAILSRAADSSAGRYQRLRRVGTFAGGATSSSGWTILFWRGSSAPRSALSLERLDIAASLGSSTMPAT